MSFWESGPWSFPHGRDASSHKM